MKHQPRYPTPGELARAFGSPLPPGVHDYIADLINTAYAAGRARGMEQAMEKFLDRFPNQIPAKPTISYPPGARTSTTEASSIALHRIRFGEDPPDGGVGAFRPHPTDPPLPVPGSAAAVRTLHETRNPR